MPRSRDDSSKVAMVLSGGVALGSYQAGAYCRMHDLLKDRLHWLAGSSIGAVNAAIIAGNEPHHRSAQLKRFWTEAASLLPPPMMERGRVRHAYSWLSALQTRALGRPELFFMRPPHVLTRSDVISVYDLSPLADKLEAYVDFDRVNDTAVRLSIVTTDIETGEAVVFDSGKGDRIGPAHLLASCGFLPDFEPIEIDGRLLGDGGLVANAPVDVVLGHERPDEDLLCFVIDLFARDADRPDSIEDAAERRHDLLLANQTLRALEALIREHRLRKLLNEASNLLPAGKRAPSGVAPIHAEGKRGGLQVLHLSYRPAAEEAGPQKQFDFSRAALADRWEAGARDMSAALEVVASLADSDSKEPMLHRIR